jgi:hypothetical protein
METQNGVNRLINMFIDDMYELKAVSLRQSQIIRELQEKNTELEKKLNTAVGEKLKEARKIGR